MSDLFIAPHAQPLKGDEGLIYATWKFMRNPLEGFGPLAYSQGIVSVKQAGIQMHVLTDPEAMNTVLVKNAAKFTKAPIDARILGPATKEGLLSVHGDQWKKQRRAVAPIFRARHMSDLSPLVAQVVDGFKDRLGAGKDVELNAAMADLTFDVLSKALLGDPKGLDRDRLKVATRRVVTSAGTLRPDDLVPWPRGTPRPMGPRGYIALRKLKSAADHLIKTRKNDPGDDLVGLLIGAQDPKTGERLSLREQRDNLIGFFIAGHETTALTLTWALYLAAKDPSVQARIREEASVLGTDNMSFDTLDNLPFTRAVIDETMRLFPPAPIINRECHESCEVLGRTINPGDVLLLCPYVMHRREMLWDNPHAFDPDRFIRNPELRGKSAPYMPFGAGPRICVGASFAILEAVTGLASLMADYEITVAEDCFPRPLMTVTLRPDGGVKARLTRITK